MTLSALPPDMQENESKPKAGTDWDFWPFKYIRQSWFAWGPNAKEWWARWRSRPVLIAGYGVSRWMGARDHSILEIRSLAARWLFWWQTKGEVIVIERQPDHPAYGQSWKASWEWILMNYGPSPLSKFSDESCQVTWPLHVAAHLHGELFQTVGPNNGGGHLEYRTPFFVRLGARWVSGSDYYDCPSAHVGEWN